MDEETNKPQSVVLNLETLQAEYEAVLLQYNQVQRDYMVSIKQQLNTPCHGFNPDSKGVSQVCIDDIWHKAGCITQAPSATDSLQQQQTLSNLVNDVFKLSTMTDDEHRKRCYDTTELNYDKYNVSTSPDYKIDQFKLVDIKGQSFWGSGSVSEGPASSLEECKSLCSSKPKCSGATYNPDKKYCWLRSGEGRPIPSLENDYAIIPETKKYLNLLQSLNKRLTDINSEILDIINTNQPLYESQTKERQQQVTVLQNNVTKLDDERKKISLHLQTHRDLNQARNQTDLSTTRFYYLYLLFFVIAVLVIVLMFNILLPSSQSTNSGNSGNAGTPLVVLFALLCFFIYVFAKK